MKKIKMSLIALFVCALGYSGYSAYDYMTMTDAERFLLQNVEALTQDGEGGSGNPANYNECLSAGGNWNMASVCQDSGFERITCKISGEINAFGFTIKGNYEKGNQYNIPWARYSCVSSENNCCVMQGLYSNGKKLA